MHANYAGACDTITVYYYVYRVSSESITQITVDFINADIFQFRVVYTSRYAHDTLPPRDAHIEIYLGTALLRIWKRRGNDLWLGTGKISRCHNGLRARAPKDCVLH